MTKAKDWTLKKIINKAVDVELNTAIALSKSLHEELKAKRKRSKKVKEIPLHLMKEPTEVQRLLQNRLYYAIIKNFELKPIKHRDDGDTPVWNKTSLYCDIAPGDLSWDDVNETERMSYYVEKLMPPIEISHVRMGDKFLRMSMIPGRKKSFLLSPGMDNVENVKSPVPVQIKDTPAQMMELETINFEPVQFDNQNNEFISPIVNQTEDVKDPDPAQSTSRFLSMFNKSQFSDFLVLLKSGEILHLHKFVLMAWNCGVDILRESEWYITDIEEDVVIRIMKHLYADGAENIDDLLETDECRKFCELFGLNPSSLMKRKYSRISYPSSHVRCSNEAAVQTDEQYPAQPFTNIHRAPTDDHEVHSSISSLQYDPIHISNEEYQESTVNQDQIIINTSRSSNDLFDSFCDDSLLCETPKLENEPHSNGATSIHNSVKPYTPHLTFKSPVKGNSSAIYEMLLAAERDPSTPNNLDFDPDEAFNAPIRKKPRNNLCLSPLMQPRDNKPKHAIYTIPPLSLSFPTCKQHAVDGTLPVSLTPETIAPRPFPDRQTSVQPSIETNAINSTPRPLFERIGVQVNTNCNEIKEFVINLCDSLDPNSPNKIPVHEYPQASTYTKKKAICTSNMQKPDTKPSDSRKRKSVCSATTEISSTQPFLPLVSSRTQNEGQESFKDPKGKKSTTSYVKTNTQPAVVKVPITRKRKSADKENTEHPSAKGVKKKKLKNSKEAITPEKVLKPLFNPFTPMPDFSLMKTPEIENKSSLIGLKKGLSKKQKIKVLQKVHEETHKIDRGSEESDSSAMDESEVPVTQVGNNATQESKVEDFNDKEELFMFLKTNYSRDILKVNPLLLDKVMAELKLNGINMAIANLKNYLDYQCILYDDCLPELKKTHPKCGRMVV